MSWSMDCAWDYSNVYLAIQLLKQIMTHRFTAILATYSSGFLYIFLDLCIQPILCFVLPEIGFQFLRIEHLPPEEVNLDAKILEL